MTLFIDPFDDPFKPPPDPILLGARGQRPINYNSAVGRKLFHQSHMPLGEHAGKLMERVPAAYLLQRYRAFLKGIRNRQERKAWFPVFSYVDRHFHELESRAATEDAKPKPEPAPRLDATLVSPDVASACSSPSVRCELCHDAPVPCECDPKWRTERVLGRLNH